VGNAFCTIVGEARGVGKHYSFAHGIVNDAAGTNVV